MWLRGQETFLCQSNIVTFVDPPRKAERGSGVRSEFPVTWGWAILHKECHNWIFKCGTWASVHMDYYTASFTNAQNNHKVYWDSWKTAYKTGFPIRFIIWSLTSCKPNYGLIGNLKSEISPAPCDKKCRSDHQTLFVCVDGVGRRLG